MHGYVPLPLSLCLSVCLSLSVSLSLCLSVHLSLCLSPSLIIHPPALYFVLILAHHKSLLLLFYGGNRDKLYLIVLSGIFIGISASNIALLLLGNDMLYVLHTVCITIS